MRLGGVFFFIVAHAFVEFREDGFDGPVQVKEELWFGQSGVQHRKKALEKPKFLFAEVVFGKKQGFDKKIVGHGKWAEQIGLGEMLQQLFVAFRHKKQLHGEGIALRLLVKKGQEGVVRELFEDQSAGIPFGQALAKGGFAGADVAFHGDELIWESCVQVLG